MREEWSEIVSGIPQPLLDQDEINVHNSPWQRVEKCPISSHY